MVTQREVDAATAVFEELMVGTKTVNELVVAILQATEKERER